MNGIQLFVPTTEGATMAIRTAIAQRWQSHAPPWRRVVMRAHSSPRRRRPPRPRPRQHNCRSRSLLNSRPVGGTCRWLRSKAYRSRGCPAPKGRLPSSCARCALRSAKSASSGRELLREDVVEGAPISVFSTPNDKPDAVKRVTREEAAFWRSVTFSSARPAWFKGEPDPLGRKLTMPERRPESSG